MLLRKRKIIAVVTALIALLFCTGSVCAFEIEDVSYIWEYLELDHFFTDILRMLGNWLYEFLSGILEFCYDGFTELMNFDLLNLSISKTVIQNMNKVTYSLLFVGFVVVVLVKMFTLENQLKTLLNVVLSMMFVGCFSVMLTLMSNAKTSLIKETDAVVGKGSYTISENILANNTVDIYESMLAGKVEYLDVSQVEYYDDEARMTKSVLGDVIVGIDDDGNLITEPVQDGIMGNGDVRYYRYRTDYMNVNVTLFVSIIIYFLAIFKLAYLLWNWLQFNIFGRISMLKGFNDVKAVGSLFASGLKMLLGQVILYFSMMMFSFLCSEIMSVSTLKNWLVKDVLIFSIGMAIVVGSGFVNDYLGIDDGSNFALRSVFMASRLGRIFSKPIKTGKNILSKGYDTLSDSLSSNFGSSGSHSSPSASFSGSGNVNDNGGLNDGKDFTQSNDAMNNMNVSGGSYNDVFKSSGLNSNNGPHKSRQYEHYDDGDSQNVHNSYDDENSHNYDDYENSSRDVDDDMKKDRDYYFDTSRYDTKDRFVKRDLGKSKTEEINSTTDKFDDYFEDFGGFEDDILNSKNKEV